MSPNGRQFLRAFASISSKLTNISEDPILIYSTVSITLSSAMKAILAIRRPLKTL